MVSDTPTLSAPAAQAIVTTDLLLLNQKNLKGEVLVFRQFRDTHQLLKEVKKRYESIPVIFLTAFGSVDLAVEALKEGAFYFFEKPVANNLERFITIINQAVRTQSLETQI